MDCDCCDAKIRDIREYYEYELTNELLVVCEECYELLQSGPRESVWEISVQELIDALP